MTSKESEVVMMTELIVSAEVGDTQEQGEVYTVETINNAIKDGEVEFVKKWISCLEQRDFSQRVCQIDEKDDKEHTFLGNALQEKQPEIAMLLVCAGADFKTLQIGGKFEWSLVAPVHQAAMKGYKELLEKMIELSPDCVNVKDDDEQTPLHWSCSEGHAEIASALISDHGADLDAENFAGMTPLHMACMEGRGDVAKTLIIHHDAKVDVRDQDTCATPLHWACYPQGDNGEIVCFLIDHGAKTNVIDSRGHTPLHWACRWGRAAAAKALLDRRAKVDVEDSDGWTPLEIAITEGAIDCAVAIVESDDHWEKALRRYNSKIDKTPFRLLISRMPEVAEKVLDKCSDYDPEISRMHEDFWVKFNFEFIEDFQDSTTDPNGGTPASEGNFSTDWGPKRFSKSNHPLAIMTEKKESWKILAHPLVCCLLHHKWLKFGQLGYFINLIIYCLFLIFLTAFTLVVPNPLSSTCNRAGAVVGNDTGSPDDTNREETQNTCEGLSATTKGGLYFSAAVIILIVMCRLVLEGFQIVRVKLHYFISLVNWMEITLYILSIISVSVFHDECHCPLRWQWQIGIVAVFLAWINLMIFFSKFPLTGVYVLMFTTICYTFLKILVLSLLLVIAFALTFFLIFHDPSVMPSPFSSPASSLLKITSMTAGDFSFNTIFGLESDGMISFPGISYILWILFIVVMPILFTNMLIGLASGDIQEIQKEASLSQLVLLVEQVLTVEEILHIMANKYYCKWRIGKKHVHPNKVDEEIVSIPQEVGSGEEDVVFSGSKLSKKLISKLHSWMKKLNHLMWGGKDYDTLDSLTRVLNPDEFFTEQKPFESVKQKIKAVHEHVAETQEQRKKEISEVKDALCHLQDKTATGHEEIRQELKHSQEQRKKEISELEEVLHQLQDKTAADYEQIKQELKHSQEEMKQQIRDEMKEALSQHQQLMIAEMRALLERKL